MNIYVYIFKNLFFKVKMVQYAEIFFNEKHDY